MFRKVRQAIRVQFFLVMLVVAVRLSLILMAVYGLPRRTQLVRRIFAQNGPDDFENLLPKYDDYPDFNLPLNDIEDVYPPLTTSTTSNKKSKKVDDDINLEVTVPISTSDPSIISTTRATKTTTKPKTTTGATTTTTTTHRITTVNYIDTNRKRLEEKIVAAIANNNITVTKQEDTLVVSSGSDEVVTTTRKLQEDSQLIDSNKLAEKRASNPKNLTETVEVIKNDDDPEFASKESQEDDSSEEDQNMVTGLISAFLGGLSRPDGSIDLDAIVGLLGSLSTQNPDGTYDFQGLTDLLRGFFGGGDDGGGSDVGAFAGGLLGAIIKGLAEPPGAKGAGILTGKIFSGLLPALSGPPDAMDGMDDMNKKKGPTLDVGGFLKGLLKTVLGASSGGDNQGGGGNKFIFIKTIVSAVSSIFAASSKKDR